MSFIYAIFFIFGIFYLIRYRLNLKKAAEMTDRAIYPQDQHDFSSILIPTEWKEMQPLMKNTGTYQLVKWGTVGVIIFFAILFGILIFTDWLGSQLLSFAYFFFLLINMVKHKGNLYLLPKGIILNSRYYSLNQIASYQAEKIIRWHELYGLHSRVDHGYKLTFKIKNQLIQPHEIVIEDREHIEKVISVLDDLGIKGILKADKESKQMING